MSTFHRNAAALFAAGLSASAASGQVQLFFAEPGFEWHVQGFNASPYHIWTAGDYWAQTFPPTTVSTAAGMHLRLFVDNNKLIAGESIQLNVKLNGTVVGQASIAEGFTGPLDFDYPFGGAGAPGAIAGPVYRVELVETNSVFPGYGAASMGLANQSWVVLAEGCYPDCNASGTLTIADFGCFQSRFAAADPYVDCNQSGSLTIADFACFQAAFAAGCP